MRTTKHSLRVHRPIAVSLAVLLCLSVLITDNAFNGRSSVKAGTVGRSGSGQTAAGSKVSSDLRGKSASGEVVKVILQLNDKPSGPLNALLNRSGVHVRAAFKNFNSLAVELPAGVVD